MKNHQRINSVVVYAYSKLNSEIMSRFERNEIQTPRMYIEN